jgi:phage-related protein
MSDLTYRSTVSLHDKPLAWLADEIASPPFSPAAKREAGFLLRRLQRNELISMPDSRPMPSIGRRCHELRIPDENVTWRIIYRVDEDAVVLLDIFAKKTETTPMRVINSCKRRLREYDSA